jgi:hypothetical protein
MIIHKDTKEWMKVLDNPESHIHNIGFESLKDLIIRNLTTTFHIDSDGEIFHQDSGLCLC